MRPELAIDSSEKVVQSIVDQVTHAVEADVTDRDALAELGLAEFDTVVVAVQSDLEASILATALRRIGARRIIAEAANDLDGSILQCVGASRVAYPERETGLRVAHSFAAPEVRDYLDVAPGYGVAPVGVGETWAGKTLATIDLVGSCGVTPIRVHRAGTVMLNPHRTEVLRLRDELIVAGLDENLERLPGAGGVDR